MTARRLTFAPAGRDLADAKSTARRAYQRARKAARPSTAATIDGFWSETLLAIDGHEPVAQAEMWRRTEHLFVLLRDRAEWAR
jgi:hypothetical protein